MTNILCAICQPTLEIGDALPPGVVVIDGTSYCPRHVPSSSTPNATLPLTRIEKLEASLPSPTKDGGDMRWWHYVPWATIGYVVGFATTWWVLFR